MSEVPSKENNNDPIPIVYEDEEEGYDHFGAVKHMKEDMKLILEQSKIEHLYWLSDYALDRVRKNQNYIILIVGGVGTGKSYMGMRFAEDIDPYFDINRILFHAKDFVELLDLGLPKGSVIMWEEVGVGLSSRDWYKSQNKLISSLFETFRRHNLILIMTVPNINFIDSRIRSMVHGYAEMIDPTFAGGQFGWTKYFHVMHTLRTGKIHHRFPRLIDEDGVIHTMRGSRTDSGNIHFTLPSKDLLEEYEIKKLEFVQWQQKTALQSYDKKEILELSISDMIKIIMKNPRKFKLEKDPKEEKISLTELKANAWVLMDIDYEFHKKKKTDLEDALRFVMTSRDYQMKSGGKEIQDSEIYTIFRLIDILGENWSAIARSINSTDKTVKKAVKDWKDNGMWLKLEQDFEGEKVIPDDIEKEDEMVDELIEEISEIEENIEVAQEK